MKIKSLSVREKYCCETHGFVLVGELKFEEEDLGSVELSLNEEETKSLLALALPIFERVFGEKISKIKQEIERQVNEQ